VPQEWIFGVAVALATNAGAFVVLSLAVSAIPLAILASIYGRARAIASPAAGGIVVLVCGVALLESFGARAQVLGWGALAAFVAFLERRDRWYYAAFPTAVVWANLHASVALAPVLVLARLAATLVDGGSSAVRRSRDLPMLGAVALAMFCTPFGWRLPYLALTLATSPIRHYIQEWQPPNLHDASFVYGALPIALLILAGKRATLAGLKQQSFPAMLMFVAALLAFRNTALFAIVAAPLAARGLDAIVPRIGAADAKARELEPVALVAIVLAIAGSAFGLARIQAHEPPPLPGAAIASLARDRAGHRLFCENFTWCSMALQYPNLRVFIDGRCDGYPLDVWRQYVTTMEMRPSWRAPLVRYRVDSVLAQRGSPLATALDRSQAWHTAFSDRRFVLFRS